MPCRREEEEEAGEEEEEEEEEEDSVLLLEQSVTLGGSGEVDRLVAQIGETLQLDAAQDRPASPGAPPGPPLQPPRPLAAVRAEKALATALPPLLPPGSAEAGGPAPPGALRCPLGDRGRVRGRTAPYFVAELATGPSALSPLPTQLSLDGPSGAVKRGAPQPLSGPRRRGWLRGAAASRRLQQRRGPQPQARTGDDDPHRLLQQLVLSGNLIKEAVRRLHSRRLQLHAKLPQRPLLGPLSAPVHEPPSPRSPRAACSDPGASGRRTQLRTGDGVRGWGDLGWMTRRERTPPHPNPRPPPPPLPWDGGDHGGDTHAFRTVPGVLSVRQKRVSRRIRCLLRAGLEDGNSASPTSTVNLCQALLWLSRRAGSCGILL